ncbi:hypothetical protein XANCAGTX0491_009547 [Xanthoria calcicola]
MSSHNFHEQPTSTQPTGNGSNGSNGGRGNNGGGSNVGGGRNSNSGGGGSNGGGGGSNGGGGGSIGSNGQQTDNSANGRDAIRPHDDACDCEECGNDPLMSAVSSELPTGSNNFGNAHLQQINDEKPIREDRRG